MVTESWRDNFFRMRQDVKFWYFRNRVDLQHVNLGAFRFFSDMSLDLPLFKKLITTNFSQLNNQLIETYKCTNVTTIFVNLGLIIHFAPFLEAIYDSFSGIFIVDTLDQSLESRPAWISPKAHWAAAHLTTPFESSGLLIPLGVEEARRGTNNRKFSFNIEHEKVAKVLVGPFGITHPERISLLSWNQTPAITIQKSRIAPRDYASISSKHMFVLCPRGNGLDTHRFWEALCRGSIPIVKKSQWSQYFAGLGLPMLEVEDLSRVKAFQTSELEYIYNSKKEMFHSNSYLFDNNYWFQKILLFPEA